jgi:4-hydroxy-3-methylbut-2-en-1-yl diphosphate synthase IspG/GcpE
MGCIVNGPGEMADADFGYVGGAPGKIDLYVGKVIIPLLGCQNHVLPVFRIIRHFDFSKYIFLLYI